MPAVGNVFGGPIHQAMLGNTNSHKFKYIHKQQTTIRQPIECAPESSSGVRG